MKKLLLNIILISLSLFTSAQWKSFLIYNGDTINKIDLQGRKQGLWIYFNENYKNKIVQKGYYKDDKKEGVWEIYYPNGNLKAKITFKNNKQNGPATLYYPNGNISEQGYWKANKWIGQYKFFYENGKPKYIWFYNEQGKRTGEQKYFYPNGQLYIVGTWKDGKENGKIIEYYPNGNIKKISNWKNGKLDGEVIEYYENGQIKLKRFFVNGKEDVSKRISYEQIFTAAKTTSDSLQQEQNLLGYRQFQGTGNFKFFNQKGQVISEGFFKNGILYTGKKYFYRNDTLVRIDVYKNGQIVDIIIVKNNE